MSREQFLLLAPSPLEIVGELGTMLKVVADDLVDFR
jgi:hypothetical protein